MTTPTMSSSIQSRTRRAAEELVIALFERDFDRLADALTDDVQLRALLPSGPRNVTGRRAVADQFGTWFGDWVSIEPIETGIAQLGPRLHLHWRARVRDADGVSLVIEQHVTADALPAGESRRLVRLDLLCTGFIPENGDR